MSEANDIVASRSKNVQGVSLNARGYIGLLNPDNQLVGAYLQADYLYELSLLDYTTNSWQHKISVIFSGGLSSHSIYTRHHSSHPFNNLSIGVGVEPRYYFGFAKEESISALGVNTGWFFTLPTSVFTPLINIKYTKLDGVKYPISNIHTPSFGSTYENNIGIGVGCRRAMSQHFYLEGSLVENYHTFLFSKRYGETHLMLTVKVMYIF